MPGRKGTGHYSPATKEEAIYQTKLLIFQQAQEVIDDHIYFYNYHRSTKDKADTF